MDRPALPPIHGKRQPAAGKKSWEVGKRGTAQEEENHKETTTELFSNKDQRVFIGEGKGGIYLSFDPELKVRGRPLCRIFKEYLIN